MGTNKQELSERVIGIRHRVKKKADGEASPTQMVILEGETVTDIELEDDTAELDWALGRFPVNYRAAKPDEDLTKFPPHHLKLKRIKKDEPVKDIPPNLIRKVEKDLYVVTKVPEAYDGLRAGDTVAMSLGGSGDIFAYALSRQGEKVGAKVLRIPPFVLKDNRELDKAEDAKNLAMLAKQKPELFYETGPRDRNIIALIEAYRAREDAMKARMACAQRLLQHLIGQVFTSPDGLYPEGDIAKLYDEAKANDKILAALEEEESKRENGVCKAIKALDVFQEVFAPVEGAGPMISARFIAAIIDIRRFESKAKLKAFCGAHVLTDGRFARRRAGSVANWNATARQALYLIGEQFNRRPDSEWGQKLIAYKAKLRAAHPDVVVVDGKKRYTNGHILKMALWRTTTKFVEYVFRKWWEVEKRARTLPVPLTLPTATEAKDPSKATTMPANQEKALLSA